MIFYGPKAQLDSEGLKKAMKRKKWFPGIYLVTSATDRDFRIEVYNSPQLSQKFFSTRKLLVLGIAVGYQEALNLVCTIMDDVYRKTGGADIKEYLRKQQV